MVHDWLEQLGHGNRLASAPALQRG